MWRSKSAGKSAHATRENNEAAGHGPSAGLGIKKPRLQDRLAIGKSGLVVNRRGHDISCPY